MKVCDGPSTLSYGHGQWCVVYDYVAHEKELVGYEHHTTGRSRHKIVYTFGSPVISPICVCHVMMYVGDVCKLEISLSYV